MLIVRNLLFVSAWNCNADRNDEEDEDDADCEGRRATAMRTGTGTGTREGDADCDGDCEGDADCDGDKYHALRLQTSVPKHILTLTESNKHALNKNLCITYLNMFTNIKPYTNQIE